MKMRFQTKTQYLIVDQIFAIYLPLNNCSVTFHLCQLQAIIS